MSKPMTLVQVVDALDEIAPQLKFIALAIEAIPEGHEGVSTGAASALLRLHGDLLALREAAALDALTAYADGLEASHV